MFVVSCSLSVVRCQLFVVSCSLSVVRCQLFVVGCHFLISSLEASLGTPKIS
ncbi:MAG: hypothetical protein ACKPHQ_06310 [Dolichospermum sp.]